MHAQRKQVWLLTDVPDDVDGPGADLGVLAHDADAGRERAVDAEHHRLRLGWQHRQEEVHRCVVTPGAAETSYLHSDGGFVVCRVFVTALYSVE